MIMERFRTGLLYWMLALKKSHVLNSKLSLAVVFLFTGLESKSLYPVNQRVTMMDVGRVIVSGQRRSCGMRSAAWPPEIFPCRQATWC